MTPKRRLFQHYSDPYDGPQAWPREGLFCCETLLIKWEKGEVYWDDNEQGFFHKRTPIIGCTSCSATLMKD